MIRIAAIAVKAFHSNTIAGDFDDKPSGSQPCCYIDKTQQPAFAGERVHAGKKLLQSLKVRFAFDGDQLIFAVIASLSPPGRNGGRIGRGVRCAQHRKSGFNQQVLILSRRTENVVPDRTACRNLLVRDRAPDDQRIAEQQLSSRLKNAKQLAQQ